MAQQVNQDFHESVLRKMLHNLISNAFKTSTDPDTIMNAIFKKSMILVPVRFPNNSCLFWIEGFIK